MAAPGAAAASSSSPYVYPPPLFGRVDDPFFGFVPPLVSFPPWWRRRVKRADGPAQDGARGAGPGTAPRASAALRGWFASRLERSTPVKGQVDMTVDMSGQVFLRGVVASDQAARRSRTPRGACRA